MPARKHRKDKFGMPSSTFVSTTDAERISSAQILVRKLLHAEEMASGKSHYVSRGRHGRRAPTGQERVPRRVRRAGLLLPDRQGQARLEVIP